MYAHEVPGREVACGSRDMEREIESKEEGSSAAEVGGFGLLVEKDGLASKATGVTNADEAEVPPIC